MTKPITEWEKELGLNLYERIFTCGWSVERAFTEPSNRRHKRELTYKGVTKLLSEYAKECGLSSKTLRCRIDAGWSMERALTEPLQEVKTSREGEPITYKGKTQSLKDWANELHINYYTLSNRINTLGWSIERTLMEPIDVKKASKRSKGSCGANHCV